MSTSSPLSSAAYQACLSEALAQCPLVIKRWCLGLTDILQERSTVAHPGYEKRVLQSAAAALKANQGVIQRELAIELGKAISLDTQAGNSAKVDHQLRSFSSLRFDQLELMGDEQVQETLENARLQQFLLLASDASLAEFSARLSTAQGFKTVQADKNPLRPEIFSQALLKLLRCLPVENELRSRWLTHGAQLLGKELQSFYVTLDALLEQHGVALAPYGVAVTPDDKNKQPTKTDALERSGTHGGSSSSGSSGSSGHHGEYSRFGSHVARLTHTQQAAGPVGTSHNEAGANRTTQSSVDRQQLPPAVHGLSDTAGPSQFSREQLLTLDHLHRLMVGDYDDAFENAAAAHHHGEEQARQDYLQTQPAAMDALAELEQPGAVQQAGLTPALPVALLREQLKAGAKNMGQALGVEVVGLMIEQLASDARLLPPVRQLITDAEPAFLRLGMTDPRFFSDKTHPARRLLEVITANSLAYSDEDAPGFAEFMHDLQEVTAVLTQGHLSDAHDFAALLADFEEKQNRQARHHHQDGQAQQVAVQALLRAEQRHLLAEKIALEIRARPDFISGNRVITNFLTGPWAQVMAHERLLGEHGGIGSAKAIYSLTLGDLLWSLDVKQASRHRKRLVKIIPGMLSAIRDGLLSIDYPIGESKAFYDALMASHQAVLKPSPDQQQARSSSHRALDRAFEAGDGQATDDSPASQPWLAPREAQQSGFMEDWETNSPSPAPVVSSHPEADRYEPTCPADLRPAADDDTHTTQTRSQRSADLLLGAWVELLSGKHWLRAQLTWISPHNTLFMFTSDGGRSHSMTSRMLQQLRANNRVRVISDQGLLEGALDGVARAAVRNSVDIGTDG